MSFLPTESWRQAHPLQDHGQPPPRAIRGELPGPRPCQYHRGAGLYWVGPTRRARRPRASGRQLLGSPFRPISQSGSSLGRWPMRRSARGMGACRPRPRGKVRKVAVGQALAEMAAVPEHVSNHVRSARARDSAASSGHPHPRPRRVADVHRRCSERRFWADSVEKLLVDRRISL